MTNMFSSELVGCHKAKETHSACLDGVFQRRLRDLKDTCLPNPRLRFFETSAPVDTISEGESR